jgi:hypothetical protein
LKNIDRDYWLAETAKAHRSAKRGYVKAAVSRLARLQRRIEKEFYRSVISRWSAALLHSLMGGIYNDAGDYHNANAAYLKAATLAFGDVYSSIDLMTNSLWAAEECARSARVAPHAERLSQIQKLNDKGSRFTKAVGDMLNDQLIDAKLAPVIFGGAYPAKVALTPEQHKWFERLKKQSRRKGARSKKALAQQTNLTPENEPET